MYCQSMIGCCGYVYGVVLGWFFFFFALRFEFVICYVLILIFLACFGFWKCSFLCFFFAVHWFSFCFLVLWVFGVFFWSFCL